MMQLAIQSASIISPNDFPWIAGIFQTARLKYWRVSASFKANVVDPQNGATINAYWKPWHTPENPGDFSTIPDQFPVVVLTHPAGLPELVQHQDLQRVKAEPLPKATKMSKSRHVTRTGG